MSTLELGFEEPEDFAREYANNIANGGVFIETTEPFEIRDKVRVHLTLFYAKKNMTLDGEVVHIVSEAIAAEGSMPGIAVHFDTAAAELRELFEPLVANVPVVDAPMQDDRRAAPRSRARVAARVLCPGWDEVAGRTRDLSITGVLVSVTGVPPIDVGEPVEVYIADSETGTEQLILGKVARHVEGEEGIVRAIGVQFHIPDSERAEIEWFLANLAAHEHARHLGGIKGAIEEIGLGNLIQTFGLASRDGTLDVIRGAEEGYIVFQDSTLRSAALGGASGVKALSRMLGWTDGSFEFHARVDETLPTCDSLSLEAALLEATRLMDESSGVDRRNFPLDAILHVDELQRSEAGALSKLDDAVLDLASTGMNVQCVLDIVPEADGEIYLALERLVDSGIVEVWGLSGEAALDGLRQRPHAPSPR